MERKFHLFWAVLADSGFPPGRGIVRFYAAFEAGDSDGDGLNDAFETLALGTSTNSPDSDGDGVSDATEYAAGIDPVVKGAPVCDALGCRKGAPFSTEDAAAIANPHFKGRSSRPTASVASRHTNLPGADTMWRRCRPTEPYGWGTKALSEGTPAGAPG